MASIVKGPEVPSGSIDAFHNEPCEIGPEERRRVMSLGTILIVLLILALIGVLPTWGYSSGWGYGPGGIVGVLLVVIIILALLGRM
jgi:peptidoglycan/LPS O-acetylase OafA/YrhL